MPDNELTRKKQGEFTIFCRRLGKNKLAVLGLCVFIAMCIATVFATSLTPYNFDEMDMSMKLKPPTWEHPFGTDNLGRDVLARVLYGGRYSLSLGLIATLVALALGIIAGAFAGYYGGIVDTLIMRCFDVIQAIPSILIAIVTSAIVGTGFMGTIFAIALPGVPGYARLLRGQFLSVGQQEYVEAATSLSCSKLKIMFKHILPNAFSPLIVSATMNVANAVLTAASLSFIGLGVQSGIPEWGAMLSSSRNYMRDYPYMVIFPGLCIMISVLCLNLLGDGVRDALDPKLKD